MYTVLLVDDEPQIRKGLSVKLNWNEYGFELCGEAADGKEAMERIEVLKPDVVITDIRMPVMDGIALLQSCAVAHPDIQFIVLSGYEEFDYAKAALQYRARDYLLKPVIRKELSDRLDQIRIQLDHQRRISEEGDDDRKRQLDQSMAKLLERVDSGRHSGGNEAILLIVDYLQDHYADEDISLAQMAERYHLHVTYLSELFKKTIGKNYSDYVSELRIEKAKQLMEDRWLRVVDIAGLVGFSNANYFSLVFKKLTGMTPIEYRQQRN